MNALWQAVQAAIDTATGSECTLSPPRGVGGGCINSAYTVEAGDHTWFVKVNDAHQLPMFEAEAAGLAELAGADAVRVPAPLCTGNGGGHAFLVMEHLPLGGPQRGSAELLGSQLAALHRHQAEQFGWRRDNTIGSTPQINKPAPDWIGFWRDQRLGYQLELAARRGAGARLGERGRQLQERLAGLFDGYTPVPSLLHGDLWGGNWAVAGDGEPVLFDPAVYYGDREADLAMTELFGGFPSGFYAAYREAWPLDAGYTVRKSLYNLYHVLNHYNLFGGGYLGQAQALIDRLLTQLGNL